MSVENNKPAAELSKLLGELGDLAKAMPAPESEPDGDEKIADAAADGAGDADPKLGEDGKPMTKSLRVTLADGTEVDAEDGTELVKSLIGRLDETEDVMAKALGAAVDLIKKQGEQIAATNSLVKSLRADVTKLSTQPAGRKTVLTVHEKPAGAELAKSQPQGDTPEEFMTKALAAQKDGRLTGLDVSVAEASLNRGAEVPSHIVNAVYRKA